MLVKILLRPSIFSRSCFNIRCKSTLVRKNYSKLNSQHIQQFERILGSNGVLSSNNATDVDLEPFNADWLQQYKGTPEKSRYPLL